MLCTCMVWRACCMLHAACTPPCVFAACNAFFMLAVCLSTACCMLVRARARLVYAACMVHACVLHTWCMHAEHMHEPQQQQCFLCVQKQDLQQDCRHQRQQQCHQQAVQPRCDVARVTNAQHIGKSIRAKAAWGDAIKSTKSSGIPVSLHMINVLVIAWQCMEHWHVAHVCV